MGIRTIASTRLAGALLWALRPRVSKGYPLSLSLSTWRLLPESVTHWLGWRVFEPAGESALPGIRSHPLLGRLVKRAYPEAAITPSMVLFVWRTLQAVKPRRILEFGSGLSTRLFATYAAEAAQHGRRVSIVSIEHERHWFEQTRADLAESRLDSHVELVHAPLSEQPLLGEQIVAYTIPEGVLKDATRETGFDFCLIDGPPGIIGRKGSLPLAAPHLSAGAMVILDDAFRAGEQDSLKRWRRAFARQTGRSRLLLVDRHGPAVFKWNLASE